MQFLSNISLEPAFLKLLSSSFLIDCTHHVQLISFNFRSRNTIHNLILTFHWLFNQSALFHIISPSRDAQTNPANLHRIVNHNHSRPVFKKITFHHAPSFFCAVCIITPVIDLPPFIYFASGFWLIHRYVAEFFDVLWENTIFFYTIGMYRVREIGELFALCSNRTS